MDLPFGLGCLKREIQQDRSKHPESADMCGKSLRLKRFLRPLDGRVVILPLDHGVTCGPIPGLQRVEHVIRMGIRVGCDGMVVHKGMMRFLEPIAERLPGIFMHLSASTGLGPSLDHKVLVGTVEEAVRRGADGVSVHVNLGGEQEPAMIEDLGRVAGACAKWQMPLLVMIYVRGNLVSTPVPDSAIAHAARVAAELGADIIKIPAPAQDAVLAEITGGLPVPVVVAGGSRFPDTRLLLDRIAGALAAGAGGFAIGRNVFQHEDPEALLRAVCNIVHHGFSSEKAWEQLVRAGSPPADRLEHSG